MTWFDSIDGLTFGLGLGALALGLQLWSRWLDRRRRRRWS